MKKSVIGLVFSIIFLNGCAEYDCIQATTFEPIATCEPGYTCFSYKAPANFTTPKDTVAGENYRIKMLEMHLKENGYKNYEIASRTAIRIGGTISSAYNIFYVVKVKQDKEEVLLPELGRKL